MKMFHIEVIKVDIEACKNFAIERRDHARERVQYHGYLGGNPALVPMFKAQLASWEASVKSWERRESLQREIECLRNEFRL